MPDQITASRSISAGTSGGFGGGSASVSVPSPRMLNVSPINNVDAVDANLVSSYGTDEAQYVNTAIAKVQSALDKHLTYTNNMWVEEQTSKAQLAMVEWYAQESQTPTLGAVDRYNKTYSEVLKVSTEDAPTTEARLMLTEKLNKLNVGMMEKVLYMEASTSKYEVRAQIGREFQYSAGMISKTNDPDMLYAQQDRLQNQLNMAVEAGKVTREERTMYEQDIQDLALQMAENMATQDPIAAKAILKKTEGKVDYNKWSAVNTKIDKARGTRNELFKVQLEEQAQKHINAIEEKGQPNPLFSYEAYGAVNGPEGSYALKATEDAAWAVYKGREELKGLPIEKQREVLSKHQFANPSNVQELANNKLEAFAAAQQQLMAEDPYTYSLGNPMIRQAQEDYQNAKPENKPAAMKKLIDRSATLQMLPASKGGYGKAEYEVDVLSNQTAEALADRLNKATPEQIQNDLKDVIQQYGDYSADAFRNMMELPEGKRISPYTSLLAMNVDKPVFAEAAEAFRTKEADFKLKAGSLTKTEQSKQISDEVSAQSAGLREALLAVSRSGATESYIAGLTRGAEQLAKHRVSVGSHPDAQEAAQSAYEDLLSSEFHVQDNNTWGSDPNSGKSYVLRKRYTGSNGFEMQRTQEEFDQIADLLPILTDVSGDPRTKDYAIDMALVDTSNFGISPNMTPEGQSEKAKRVIESVAFWGSNESQTGLVLYLSDANGNAQPVNKVGGGRFEYSVDQLLSMYNSATKQRGVISNNPFESL